MSPFASKFQGDRQPVGAPGVDEVGEGPDPLVEDASRGVHRQDAGEVGALVPELGTVRQLALDEGDDVRGSHGRRIDGDAEPGPGDVAREDPRVVPGALDGP